MNTINNIPAIRILAVQNNDSGTIFLSKVPHKYSYEIPGGSIKKGETLQDAVTRLCYNLLGVEVMSPAHILTSILRISDEIEVSEVSELVVYVRVGIIDSQQMQQAKSIQMSLEDLFHNNLNVEESTCRYWGALHALQYLRLEGSTVTATVRKMSSDSEVKYFTSVESSTIESTPRTVIHGQATSNYKDLINFLTDRMKQDCELEFGKDW